MTLYKCALFVLWRPWQGLGAAGVAFSVLIFFFLLHAVFSKRENWRKKRNPWLMFSNLYKRFQSTCDSLLAQTNLSQSERGWVLVVCINGKPGESGRMLVEDRSPEEGCALKPQRNRASVAVAGTQPARVMKKSKAWIPARSSSCVQQTSNSSTEKHSESFHWKIFSICAWSQDARTMWYLPDFKKPPPQGR